ncbi:DUF956 family protein [Melissococcus plutonius]|uniref:Putative regulator of the mannose operon, ManO n=1 Tax=Melissococcus plutonius TaxID=33970 RepID=A0A2Z5Y055_9ENTE|nr:DUF956 family protein [Melissococcus plutonius]BAL61328.1 putative regulator of the mannose operon, ManO [Melissococcus plutonius DAT561]MCV2498730.1 DUF956 family protein [Melissococcus plutonius]MCV2501631.1 DUF956 family protein [Melissococcus plutonius]MCV2504990.1 DUF956 family protein [Melissococcus plutonius]MCV2507346.1 DUF956 family protein [Melissococcus plutonius]
MVQSINTKVDLVIDATSFTGLTDYGKIMIGDKGFEFYHARDVQKFIQIPWEEVTYIFASAMFKGKWIPRYAIQTKTNGTFTFSSKKPKVVLRTIRNYVEPSHMVQSLSFFDVIKRALKTMINRKII